MLSQVFGYLAEQESTALDKDDLEKAVHVSAVLLGRPKFIEYLNTILQESMDDRKCLWNAFLHDVDYLSQRTSAEFTLAFDTLPESIRATTRELLGWLYDDVFVDGCFRGLPTANGKDLNRAVYFDSHEKANPRASKICPVCLQPINELANAECDHFLPRNHYPALAIHPDNLAFACGGCNGKYKLAQDPLREGTTGSRCLLDSYLPYERPAEDEVDLQFQVDSTFRTATLFVAHPQDDGHASERLGNLERLYRLSRRFSSFLPDTYCELADQIRIAIGEGRERDVVLGQLQSIGRSRLPDYYLKSRLARWIAGTDFDQFYQCYLDPDWIVSWRRR
ncbi:MAG: hypothetical protein ABFD54_06480 [Armatimonadota bacterium]|nr:hypothetical protein [bacterium]